MVVTRGLPVVDRIKALADADASGCWIPLKTHCPKGHPYAGDNVIVREKYKDRLCRACVNARRRATP